MPARLQGRTEKSPLNWKRACGSNARSVKAFWSVGSLENASPPARMRSRPLWANFPSAGCRAAGTFGLSGITRQLNPSSASGCAAAAAQEMPLTSMGGVAASAADFQGATTASFVS